MMTIRKHMLALIAAAAAWGSPAAAQTGTGALVTSPKRIPGDADGVVKLDAWALKVTPALPRKTTVYGPCAGLPDFTYRVRQACPEVPPVVTPPVTPPVVKPPVVVTPPTPTPGPVPSDVVAKLLPGGTLIGVEAAIRNPLLSVGFNSDGGLGTLNNAGVGKPFTTDRKNGFLRLGMVTERGDDVLMHGRSQDMMAIIVNGTVYASGRLAGYRLIQGQLVDPFTFAGETVKWIGGTSYAGTGIKVDQRVSLAGTVLSYKVRLTNTTAAPVSVTYFRSEDPDSAANFATTNRVVTQGRWDAAMTTGETYFIESLDAGVFNAAQPYDKVSTIGTRREVGYNVKADLTLQLVWPAKVLQSGQSTDIEFRQGVK